MPATAIHGHVVRAGDIQGRLSVYDACGSLLLLPDESITRVAQGWDMTAQSPWRRVLPRVLFLGFSKPALSRLYLTTSRVVLIRDINPAREVVSDLTPLGTPNAIARGAELKKLKRAGAWQFCEVYPAAMRISRVRRSKKRVTWIGLDLMGEDQKEYSISYWKTDGEDLETLELIEARFR